MRELAQTVAWLVATVTRMLAVQAGLVTAVDRLERRTRQEGHERPAAPRRRLRLVGRVVDMTLGMVVFALVFGLGQGLLPEGPVPPAEAEPIAQEPKRTVRATTTTTVAGPTGRDDQVLVVVASGGTHRTQVQVAGVAGPGPVAAPQSSVAPPSSSTPAPSSSVTSTTQPPATLPTLPPLPPCAKKGCHDEGEDGRG